MTGIFSFLNFACDFVNLSLFGWLLSIPLFAFLFATVLSLLNPFRR